MLTPGIHPAILLESTKAHTVLGDIVAVVDSNGVVTHEGLVLAVGTRDNSLMEYTYSDATVWDVEANKPATVHLWSRHWGGATSENHKSATVDATPEVRAAFDRWADLRVQTHNTIDMYLDSLRMRVGATVKVVSGRKIKKGTVGVVTRTGRSDYGEWAVIDGTLTATSNLEVIPDFSWWTE